jgi:uncharacterized protein with von Willebrand factor type A (vWA) domain
MALAKSIDEKARFSECFDRFFHQLAFQQPPRRAMLRNVDTDALIKQVRGHGGEQLAALVRAIVTDERDLIALRVQAIASEAGIQQMHTLRDKAPLAHAISTGLGLDALDALAREGGAFAPALRYLRSYAAEQVRHFVDDQYRLIVDASGRRALLEAALSGQLAHVSPGYHAEIERVVRKLADRLARRYRRRRRDPRRGALDLGRLLRDNVAYDGTSFKLAWKNRRPQRATVFVLCDVSGSVSRVARFLLLVLHELASILPNVRSFAFSNRLGEITDLFRAHEHGRAIEEALLRWGNGNTDYGRALLDFREAALKDVDHRSTVVILGDARSNFYDPRTDVLKRISARAKQLFWLNPERRDMWATGDSEMARYAPYCLRVDRCSQLADIDRFAERLIQATR